MHLAAAAEKLRAGMVLLDRGGRRIVGHRLCHIKKTSSRGHRRPRCGRHFGGQSFGRKVEDLSRWHHSTLLRRPCMVSSASRAHSERLCAFAVAITPRRPSRIRRFDLSVVQLSAEGPDLPAECELARNDELQNIEGRLVGLLSYPGRGDAQLPDVSDSRFAEFARA